MGWFSLYQEQDAEPLDDWAARARVEGMFDRSHPVLMTNHSMQVRLQLPCCCQQPQWGAGFWERGNCTRCIPCIKKGFSCSTAYT